LTLRLAAISFVLYGFVVFPDTRVFKLLTHWCEHSVLPLVGVHVDIQGHAVGAALVLVPVVGAGSALLLAAGRTARTVRAVNEMLRSRALGAGPGDSVIVGGPEVIVAAAGLMHPRVVLTAGALATLEDDELAAGLAHEHGHIARRHHLLLVYAEAVTIPAEALARGPGQVAPHVGHYCSP